MSILDLLCLLLVVGLAAYLTFALLEPERFR